MKLVYNGFDFSTIGELSLTESRQMEGAPDLPQRAAVTLRVRVDLFEGSYDANRQLIEQALTALATPAAVLQWTNDAAGVDYVNQTASLVSDDLPEEWGEYFQELNLVFKYYEQSPGGVANSIPLTYQPDAGGGPVTMNVVNKWVHSASVERFDPKRPQRRETHARIHIEGQFFGDMTLDLADRRTALAAQTAALGTGMNGSQGLLQFGGSATDGTIFSGEVRVEEWNCELDQLVAAINFSFTCGYTVFPDEDDYATAEFTSAEKTVFNGEVTLTVSGRIQSQDEPGARAKLEAILAAVIAQRGYALGQKLSLDTNPNTISANQDGDTFTELSFNAQYRKWRTTNRLATFQRTGGTGQPVAMGQTRLWHLHYSATRFNEMRSQRRHATGNVEAAGTFPGDMRLQLSDRRAALDAMVNALYAEVNNADGVLSYGTNWSRTVRIEDFKAEVNQEETGVDWSLSASWSDFPNEGGYATAEFTVDQRQTVEDGEEYFTFAGRIAAPNGAAARAKLDSLRSGILGIYSWTIAQQLRSDSNLSAVYANGDATAGIDEGLEAPDCQAEVRPSTDGTTFLELTFNEEYRRRIPGNLVSYTLQVSQREDVPSQMLLTTYAGTVSASGTTADAAYAVALAQAQALGASREAAIDSTAYLRGSTITYDERQTTQQNALEFVRLGFNYEYQSKLSAGRAFIEMTMSVNRDSFGTDVETCSGYVAARDAATAQAIYLAQVRAFYANRIIHSESTGFSKTLNQVTAPAGGYNLQDTRIEFNLTVFSPKAVGAVAFRYSLEVSRDFLACEMRTAVRGSCYAADRPTADTALAALLLALNPSGSLSLRSNRTEDDELVSGIPGLGNGQMLRLDFEEEYISRLAGVTGVLEMKLTERVQYSGTRWAVQDLPYTFNTDGSIATGSGVSIPQQCGVVPGSRTVSGSVTAASLATAQAWAKQQLALLTGDANDNSYPQPEQWETDYEFVPRVDGISQGVGQNVKLWRVNFQFGEILPWYPPPN